MARRSRLFALALSALLISLLGAPLLPASWAALASSGNAAAWRALADDSQT